MSLVGVAAACVVGLLGAGAWPAPASALVCDREGIAARAQDQFPEHLIQAVDSHPGVVTLSLTPRAGGGRLAIALHATGADLSTSVMGEGLDEAEIKRLSLPLTGWWQDDALQ